MTKSIPFTYRVTHIPTGNWYYGVKYSTGCKPEDLWNTYFTSSFVVRYLIEQTGVDSFSAEIRKIFANKQDAINWELKVLRKVLNSPKCLNQSAFPAISYDAIVRGHQTKCKIDPISGLTIYQKAAQTWKLKKNLIDDKTGKTFEELRLEKYRKTILRNGTNLNKPNPKILGNDNPMKKIENALKVSIALKDGFSSGRIKPSFSGKLHSEKSKRLQSFVKLGERNPCYGTFFINNGIENKRIPKGSEIPAGWVKGRYITKQHKNNAKNKNVCITEFFCHIETKKHTIREMLINAFLT